MHDGIDDVRAAHRAVRTDPLVPCIALNGSITVSGPISTPTSIVVAVGIDDRHAGAHVAFEDLALGELRDAREVDAVVDAEHQALVGEPVGDHRQPVGAHQLECLGQVVLALGVIGGQARQRLAQRTRREHVDTAVDLADLQLGLRWRRPARLVSTIRSSVPSRGADDAPVPGRGPPVDGRDGRGGAGRPVRRDQRLIASALDQRHVAAEDDHRRVVGRGPRTAPSPRAPPRRCRRRPAGSRHARRRAARCASGCSGASTRTMRSAPAPRAAAMTHSTIGRPQISCSTFGRAETMRVPRPAARIRTAGVLTTGWYSLRAAEADWGAGTRTPILRTKT